VNGTYRRWVIHIIERWLPLHYVAKQCSEQACLALDQLERDLKQVMAERAVSALRRTCAREDGP